MHYNNSSQELLLLLYLSRQKKYIEFINGKFGLAKQKEDLILQLNLPN